MARDALTISCGVVDRLKRLGLAAFLLGLVEPNSFVRAFRSWERTTPLRWRAARS